MTTADATIVPPAKDEIAAAPAKEAALSGRWERVEALLDRLGDRLNPILVKEARQAMKSRQFVVTFSLLLTFGWLWTVLFISFGVPAIFYAPVGPGVLMGYYAVLSIPLLIVVPYAAFRSLAAEREDGTFELLSITALSARQIVIGKLGSALLQMMVYYSALAPCIAFTYLLRGIDIVTIGLYLVYSFLASVLLCIFGLMMATVTRARHWQVLLSVVFVMALLVFTFLWDLAFLSILMSGAAMPLDDPNFWMANLAALSFYLPAVALGLLIAAGQVTFATENRSTPIRAVLVLPPVMLSGWMIYTWLHSGEGDLLFPWSVLAAIYWAVAGAFLTGETAQLSPRAKRHLPQSFLGRALFTWFNPGSGSGYIFAMLNLLGFMLFAWIAVGAAYAWGYDRLPNQPSFWYFTICLVGYVMGYLGLVRLGIVALRRVTEVGMLATFLCQVIAVLCGVLLPLLLQALVSWGDYSTFSYSMLQLPNFCWTLYEVAVTSAFGGSELAIIVGSVGGVVFLINLLVAAREVEHVRQAAPQRILEDDRQLHPSTARRRRNPWDEAATGTLLLAVAALVAPQAAARAADHAPQKLRIGVAQLALEPTLAASRDKIAGFIRQAKDRGCRVVVFPETALYWPPQTTKEQIDAAVAELQQAVAACDVYALIGGLYKRSETDRPFERLLVVGPDGKLVQTYNKMWGDARFQTCPGLFTIDGAPCAATLCADRWIRSVEELPVMAGARILFECSNNYDNEWLADLGWYWYVPRAVRNEVFVVFANTAKEDRAQLTPGHGHSAVISPAGELLAAAGEESDTLLVAELDLPRATAGQAEARRNHPLFRDFWETGVLLLKGQLPDSPAYHSLTSPAVELKIAAAQIACSWQIDDNVRRMIEAIRQAAASNADVVVFPELCVTGARDDDITAAEQRELEAALAELQQVAKEAGICVVCGLPWLESGRRQNCAVAIGPDGRLLTRYAQLVVDRPELFAAGTSTKAMWFEVRGVPCVVTIGRDALWSEIAELAALRGAQVHCHLAYDRDTSPQASLLRQQLWVNLASFRTFTATVNAASPALLHQPSSPAAGGSAIWDDYHRASRGKAGGYVPHSAVRLADAGQTETIVYAQQTVPRANPQFRILTERSNSQMTPWYRAGASAIFAAAGRAEPEAKE